MFRHILVPLDGSRLAAAAVPYALTLARAADARISLLAVVAPPPEHADLPSAAAQESDERQVTESTAYLESVAVAMRADGRTVTTVVRHGDPASDILAYAEEEECSLVVMSTHGRTGIERVRAGSVARRIVRHAIIPTLVVPPSNDAATEGGATITELTITLDGSTLAEEALPVAAQIAAASAAPLTLLQVIPSLASLAYGGWGDGYYNYYPVSEEMERNDDRAIKEYLEAIATRLHEPGLEVRTRSERSLTTGAEEIVTAYLAARPTGIAVMASHGRGGVLRWVLGSTVEGVLDQSPCPILIVRAGTTPLTEFEGVPVSAAQRAG